MCALIFAPNYANVLSEEFYSQFSLGAPDGTRTSVFLWDHSSGADGV